MKLAASTGFSAIAAMAFPSSAIKRTASEFDQTIVVLVKLKASANCAMLIYYQNFLQLTVKSLK